MRLIAVSIILLLAVVACDSSSGNSNNNNNNTTNDTNNNTTKDSANNTTDIDYNSDILVDMKDPVFDTPACDGTVVIKVTNENGKLHGEPCDGHDECKYGMCYLPEVTNFHHKICTKWCNCGPNSECAADDTATAQYKCYKTFPKDEKVTSYCLPVCKDVSDCAKFADFYNHCKIYHGVYKQCIYEPVEGE